MVKWRGSRQSANVEDRRGARSSSGGGGGLVMMLIQFVLSRFGIGGVVVLGLVGAGLYLMGVNPLSLVGAAGSDQQASRSSTPAADDEASKFVRAILGETEDVWGNIFAEAGAQYPQPKLVLFSGSVSSACGHATAAAGPFYCPGDQKAYLDTAFFRELSERFGAPGDFAAAYVIAHEVGHHVQTVTGISNKVRTAQARANKIESNQLQVRMELQADCYSGVWAKRANRDGQFLEDGDIEEGLQAAAAIGDDTLQRNAGRRVTPESFTHGTSAQRKRWFTIGYRTGDVDQCDTFSAREL